MSDVSLTISNKPDPNKPLSLAEEIAAAKAAAAAKASTKSGDSGGMSLADEIRAAKGEPPITKTEEAPKPDTIHRFGPTALRSLLPILGGVAGGALGGPPGAVAGGGAMGFIGENLAERLEGSPNSLGRQALEGVLAGIPLDKVYQGGRFLTNLVKGGALAEAGQMGRRVAATGKLSSAIPSGPEVGEDIKQTGLGAVMGGVLGHAIGGKGAPSEVPKAPPVEAVTPEIQNAAAARMAQAEKDIVPKTPKLDRADKQMVTKIEGQLRANQRGGESAAKALDKQRQKAIATAAIKDKIIGKEPINETVTTTHTTDIPGGKATARTTYGEPPEVIPNTGKTRRGTSRTTTKSPADPNATVADVQSAVAQEAQGIAPPPPPKVVTPPVVPEAPPVAPAVAQSPSVEPAAPAATAVPKVAPKVPKAPKAAKATTPAEPPVAVPPAVAASRAAEAEAIKTLKASGVDTSALEDAWIKKNRFGDAYTRIKSNPETASSIEAAGAGASASRAQKKFNALLKAHQQGPTGGVPPVAPKVPPAAPKVEPAAPPVEPAKPPVVPVVDKKDPTAAARAAALAKRRAIKAADTKNQVDTIEGMGTDVADLKKSGVPLEDKGKLVAPKPGEKPASPSLIKGQTGAMSPQLAMLMTRLGMGAGGAALGAYTDPLDDKTASALAGGALGAAAPSMFMSAAQHAPQATSAAETDIAHEVGKRLPNVLRFNLLSSPDALAANAFVGPWGSGVMGALEHAVQGRPEGIKALKMLMNPMEFGRGVVNNYGKAGGIIGRAEGEAVDQAGNMFDKAMSAPGRLMTTGDLAVKDILERAGYSTEEAERITLTAEPRSALARSVTRWGRDKSWLGDKSVVSKLLLPFKRTAANIMESGAERMPGLGLAYHKIANGGQTPMKEQLAQQGLGIAVFGAAYELGKNLDPEQAKYIRKFVANAAGQYSMVASAGLAAGMAAAEGKSIPQQGAAIVDRGLQDIPLPTTQAPNEIKTGVTNLLENGEFPDPSKSFLNPGIIKFLMNLNTPNQ